MSVKRHEYDDYFHRLAPAIESKVDEFCTLGYKDVSKEDIWTFLLEKKWKKPKEGVRIYELVSDVLSLKIGDYMNFATISAFKSPDLLTEINQQDLQALLEPKSK